MYQKFTAQGMLCALLFVSGSVFSQSPGGIARHSVWLQGNFFADSLQTQTLNFNPVTTLQNNKQTFNFPGTVDDLRKSTIFTVFQHPDLMQNKPVWQMSDGNGDIQLTTKAVSSISQETNMVFGDSLAGLFQPGKPPTVISTYIRRERASDADGGDNKGINIQFGPPAVGGHAVPAQGVIAELIVYETILKDKDIARIETYLGLKYGITLQRNYVNSGGQTIWNRKEDKLYSNNIAGIGRDDQLALYQKQGTSSSATDQLIIGVNQIAAANSANTGEINDGDYLIWGDNALPFKFDPKSQPTDVGVLLSDKKWLMESAGASAESLLTGLSINTKSLQPFDLSGVNFYLVIDRSGTGDFKPQDCSYVLPDQIDEAGTARFSGIKWDTDRSGKDVFTFGFNRKLPENMVDGNIRSFHVYPNPVTTGNYQVTVTLDQPGEVNMMIYDDHLHLVETRKASGQSDYMFTGHISKAAGVYVVKLITNGKVYSKILIVQ